MATYPVEPEPHEPGADADDRPNTSLLPVEPEFESDWNPVEPEEPATKPHLP